MNLPNTNGSRDDLLLLGGDLLVTGHLLMVDGEITRNSSEEVEVRGTMDASGGVFSGGSAVLHVTNGPSRTITFTEGSTTIPPLRINDSDATVLFPNVGGETFTIEGALDLDAGVLTARASEFTFEGNWTQDGGTFNGGSNDFSLDANFYLNGGIFNSTTGTYFHRGSTFYISNTGTFNHLNGLVTFNYTTNNTTVDLDVAQTFNNVTVNMPSAANGRDNLIISDQDMIVVGLLTLSDGEINTGTIEVQGTMANGSAAAGGTGTIHVTNGPSRSFTLSSGRWPTINIDDSDVTINGPSSGTTTFEGEILMNAGTLNGGAGNMAGTHYTHLGGTFTGGSGNLDVNGNFTLYNAGSSFTAPSGTLSIEGGFDHNTPATWDHNNGTVQFDDASSVTVSYNGGDLHFNNLTLAMTNSVREVRPDSDLDIDGNLTITSGRLETDQFGQIDINLAGNYTNTLGTTGLIERNSTITLDGAGSQTMDCPGGETYYNLVLAKGGGEFTLNNDLTISNLLTMTTGNLRCDAGDFIVSGYNRLSGGGSNSYFETVNGGMLQVGYSAVDATVRTIHLGDGTNYTPFTFQLKTATLSSANMRFSMTSSAHPQIGSANDFLTRYWTFDATGITGSVNYDMSYQYVDGDVSGTEANLLGAKYSGGNWLEGGSVNTTTNIITWSNVDSFSDATAMDDNPGSPLPIELIRFEAELEEDVVYLNWLTATEINNDYFTIERSANGIDYETIAEVEGAGNSTTVLSYDLIDENPLPGKSYYRLKQTDFDGTHSYSKVRIVKRKTSKTKVEMAVYPNPARDGIFSVELMNYTGSEEELNLHILDLQGRVVYSEKIITNTTGSIVSKLELGRGLPAGSYFVKMFSSDVSEGQLLIVE